MVRSAIGVPGAMAAGSGKPSCLARRIVSNVSAPPAEEPKMAILFGSDVFAAAFQTVMASSSAAGKKAAGGMR